MLATWAGVIALFIAFWPVVVIVGGSVFIAGIIYNLLNPNSSS